MSHFKKFITFSFLLFLLALSFNRFVIRSAYAITQVSGNLTVSGDFPVLTSSDGFWYPGKTITKQYTIQNTGISDQLFGVKAFALSDPDSIADHLFLALSENSTNYFGDRANNGNALSSQSLETFYGLTNSNELDLFTISAGTTRTIVYTFTMDPQLTNTQNKQVSFSLAFGYSASGSTPTVTPTSIPTPTLTPGATSTPGPGPTSTPGATQNNPSPTTEPSAGATVSGGGLVNNFFKPITNALSNILGAQAAGTSSASAIKGTVLGEQKEPAHSAPTKRCITGSWFILLLVGQIVLHLVIFVLRAKRKIPWPNYMHTIILLIFLILAGYFFCLWWVILSSGIIGVSAVSISYFPLSRKSL